MTIPFCAPALPTRGRPSLPLPAGAVDCHFHVFGPESLYPYAEARGYTPPDAFLSEYEALADTLGVSRAVIVQPSVYGFDNRRTLSILEASRLPMRAVAVLDAAVPEAELETLHARGVRGVRINHLFPGGHALTAATTLADKIRPLGWHIQFLADVSQMPELDALVARLDLPVVFDHLGHVPAAKTAADPGFQVLLGLLSEGRCWVKLSGAYRVTSSPSVPYRDARPFVEALVAANPAQLVWGTDWPHPSIPVPMPEDVALLDMFAGWIDDNAVRQMIFVRNPERLYGFDPALPELP